MQRRVPRPQDKKEVTPLVSDEVALVIAAALLAIWVGCLLWSSLASNLPALPHILAWDKLQHFLAYAILMFFSGRFLHLLYKNRLKGWIVGFIFTLGFGILMEIGQETITTSRHADGADIIANALGAGLVLFLALSRRVKRT